MKHLFSLLCLLFSVAAHAQKSDAALQVIERVTQQEKVPVTLRLQKSKGGENRFTHEVRDNRLVVTASNPVALCRGFYDYVKTNHYGLYSWSGSNISLPQQLAPSAPVSVTSPYAHHYYFNVVTYGYTMPYWDWQRWEQEIDWMALHGVDMPLALVGQEAILARVWRQMGLTEDEVNSYFAGPAHLPWLRMGNISAIDGPLNNDWYNDQIALQHRILDRMRALDMKPICPGFAGFVPQAFKRLYPGLKLTETEWAGAFHNWMITPDGPLFSEISRRYIQEWEKEFGKSEYYLVDSFNEMEIPFPEKGNPARYEMAAHYGEKVYQAIKAANPKAVWVMQGWMFGYMRHIWDEETLRALVSKVPDQKMLLLDLAVDYNKHFWHSEVNWEFYKGFFNKQWVYSVIPNMGGKVGMTGVLDFYANGHLEALNSANKGQLVAYGLAPEGIENNEVLYELAADAGWTDRHIDLRAWLDNYALNRYGTNSAELKQAWDHLLSSCYGTFTDHPRFNWQFRPGLVNRGSINLSEDYFVGLEAYMTALAKMEQTPLVAADLAEMTTHYLGGKAELLIAQIDEQYLLGDTLQAKFLQTRLETLMLGMDALLSQHPILRLDRWLDFAEKSGRTPEQKAQYVSNARRIVTIWGPPIDDYSARLWSGLIRNYYLPRWQHYYESRNTGVPFDFAAWERRWVEHNTDAPREYAPFEVQPFARRMVTMAQDIRADQLLARQPGVLGFWHVGAGAEREVSFVIPAAQLQGMKSFTLKQIKGNAPLDILSYRLEADGQRVAYSEHRLTLRQGECTIPVHLPSDLKANNGCTLVLRLRADGAAAGLTKVQ